MNDDRDQAPLIVDKDYLRQAIDKLNADMGIVPDPTVTAEMTQEMSLAQGVRPEDNILSRGIIFEREARAYSPRLDELLLDGLDSGEWIEVTPEFWQDFKVRVEERREMKDAGD